MPSCSFFSTQLFETEVNYFQSLLRWTTLPCFEAVRIVWFLRRSGFRSLTSPSRSSRISLSFSSLSFCLSPSFCLLGLLIAVLCPIPSDCFDVFFRRDLFNHNMTEVPRKRSIWPISRRWLHKRGGGGVTLEQCRRFCLQQACRMVVVEAGTVCVGVVVRVAVLWVSRSVLRLCDCVA